MSNGKTIQWQGKSGQTYKYWIYEYPCTLKAEPGNYIFAKETEPGRWKAIYIGQTGDLSERFDNHHKMPCIQQNGATHLHAHLSSENEDERRREEADLIAGYSPPCNN